MKIQLDLSDSISYNDLVKEAPKDIEIFEVPIGDTSNMLPEQVEIVKTFIIEWSSPIAQGIIAAWLYDKLKNLTGKIRINGKKMEKEDNKIKDQIKDVVENINP